MCEAIIQGSCHRGHIGYPSDISPESCGIRDRFPSDILFCARSSERHNLLEGQSVLSDCLQSHEGRTFRERRATDEQTERCTNPLIHWLVPMLLHSSYLSRLHKYAPSLCNHRQHLGFGDCAAPRSAGFLAAARRETGNKQGRITNRMEEQLTSALLRSDATQGRNKFERMSPPTSAFPSPLR